MTETKQVQVIQQQSMELSVAQVKAQLEKVREIMRSVMTDGVHYGIVPGTDKKTLLKPGAEVLCVTFRLAPTYKADFQKDGKHLSVVTTCTLTHIPTGNLIATGMGSCSTQETKYAYRKGSRKCPQCGKETIIKGKAEYGGGWLCFGKKGGCGAKFKDADKTIESQPEASKTENEDVIDQHNTVLKMSNKRALVAAVVNATGVSDIFTQDIGDSEEDDTTPHRSDPVADARGQLEDAKTLAGLSKAWDHPNVKAARARATQGELQHIINIKEKRKLELGMSERPVGGAEFVETESVELTALDKFSARIAEMQTMNDLSLFWKGNEVAALAEEMTNTAGAWDAAKKIYAARKDELTKAEARK